jgi:hypothetical protein
MRLMATGISDFALIENKSGVRLGFFVITSSEGTIVATEKAAICRKSGSDWRVAAFPER